MAIRTGDTVEALVQNSELESLQKAANVHIVGLKISGETIIPPGKVFERDHERMINNTFWFLVLGIASAILVIKAHRKQQRDLRNEENS